MDTRAYGELLAEVGRRIRGARIKAGITQEEAAHAAGMDWRRWQRLEEGTVNATLKTLMRAAKAVKTDFWSLLASVEGPRGRK